MPGMRMGRRRSLPTRGVSRSTSMSVPLTRNDVAGSVGLSTENRGTGSPSVRSHEHAAHPEDGGKTFQHLRLARADDVRPAGGGHGDEFGARRRFGASA